MLGRWTGPGAAPAKSARRGTPQPRPAVVRRRVYKTDRRAQSVLGRHVGSLYALLAGHPRKGEGAEPARWCRYRSSTKTSFPRPNSISTSRLDLRRVRPEDPHLRWFRCEEPYAIRTVAGVAEDRHADRLPPELLHDGYVMPHFETRQSGEFFQFAWKHGMEGQFRFGQWAHGPRLYTSDSWDRTGPGRHPREYYDAGPAGRRCNAFSSTGRLRPDGQIRFLALLGHRPPLRGLPARGAPRFPGCRVCARAGAAGADAPGSGVGETVPVADRAVHQTGLDHARLATKVTALFDGQELPPASRDAARDAWRNSSPSERPTSISFSPTSSGSSTGSGRNEFRGIDEISRAPYSDTYETAGAIAIGLQCGRAPYEQPAMLKERRP